MATIEQNKHLGGPFLLDCPFCGSDDVNRNQLNLQPVIACNNCWATVGMKEDSDSLEDKWNTREDSSISPDEALTLSEPPVYHPIQQWVSVEDSLPAEQEDVIATDGKSVFIAWNIGGDEMWSEDEPGGNITHWMLLPAPPKGEE